VLLADPPYFQVKDDDWDNQWMKAEQFLQWLGGILDVSKPLLAPSASVWVFVGPQMTPSVECEVAKRFQVLNSIRWVKDMGWHRRTEIEAQRCYRTSWEGVLLAEQYDDAYGEPLIGRYIQQERERAGVSRLELAGHLRGYKNIESANANIRNWEGGKNLISSSDYRTIGDALGVDYLRREYEDLRRPFTLSKHGPTTDMWTFPPVMGYPGKHPCEKPQGMLAHMIEVSSRADAIIFDPFAGSGSTLRAAKDLGRRAVGIEMDERWCEVAARRCAQDVLFGEVA
jgi:adenine-specific DNA-methyltransferase